MGASNQLKGQGIKLVIWLFPDDAPTISSMSQSEVERYMKKMVETFDEYHPMYILALEADEYWDSGKVNSYGTNLSRMTDNPIGVHQTPGKTDMMKQGWADFGAFQYGFGKSSSEISSSTSSHKGIGKPFIAGEYAVHKQRKSLGSAALNAGAAGALNGAMLESCGGSE